MNKSDKGFLTAYKLRQDLGIEPTNCIDLDYVAKELMIKVIRKDLGIGIEGACKSNGIKRLVVLNPASAGSLKERFTFSHEIGHLLIHHSSHICNNDFFNTFRTQNDEEHEANDFAAELLLPRRAMLDILARKDLTFTLIEQIAAKYKASLSVAAIRLIQTFNDNAAIIFHDGQRLIWKVASEHCFLKISDIISPMALVHKTNENMCDIKGSVDPQYWIDNDVTDLVCDEETHYLKKMKKYLTILKFYEDY